MLSKHYSLPYHAQWSQVTRALSTSERLLVALLVVLLFVSVSMMVLRIINGMFVSVPVHGGRLEEGVVGTPRFVNPLLARTAADRDLTALVYAGLLKRGPHGTFIPDLAATYEVSEDGQEYVFTLRDGLTFHDGMPVTADDVVFTVERAQDDVLKSPLRANWDGVRVRKLGTRRVQFSLPDAYAPFLENMTVGIVPQHLWDEADPEQFAFSTFNSEPVGAGPYRVKSIKRNASGVPLWYVLEAFENYALGMPYIREVRMQFYANEAALFEAVTAGDVENVTTTVPQGLATGTMPDAPPTVAMRSLPRIFAVFFNQNQAPVFADTAVRRALHQALGPETKKRLVADVLGGFATPLDGPVPQGFLTTSNERGHIPVKRLGEHQATSSQNTSVDTFEDDETATASSSAEIIPAFDTELLQARALLTDAGWEHNDNGILERTVNKQTARLSFTLATSDVPPLKAVAEFVKARWERLGAEVTLTIFDTSDLNHNVIRPRQYDALLFGQVIDRSLDLYPFWHSSQRSDPGLNVALYANISADTILETLRTQSRHENRIAQYELFLKELDTDVPAVFLYAPSFVYARSPRVANVTIDTVVSPHDRFTTIHQWYIETEKVWPFLP